MTLDELKDLHRKVFRLFDYRFDQREYGVMEHWTSHASTVNRNERFVDDCDGFAFTMVQLMLEAGHDPHHVLFLVCVTETGEGHAVSGCEIDGVTWIAENRYRSVYDWSQRSGYTWNYFMRFDQPGVWYAVDNQ